ncbi:MAG: PH domain-containing protein [Candidatus Nanohaloarchaea archaeon]
MKSLHARKKWLWILQAATIGLFAGFLLTIPVYSFFKTSASLILPLIFTVLGIVYGFKRFKNWRFQQRDQYLYIEHGVLKKTYTMVPYVRIQHIDTDRGPIDRMLGLSNLRVYTAGSRGADIKIPGLNREEALKLQKQLRDTAIESEKGRDGV